MNKKQIFERIFEETFKRKFADLTKKELVAFLIKLRLCQRLRERN
jgi:hypothetical protein